MWCLTERLVSNRNEWYRVREPAADISPPFLLLHSLYMFIPWNSLSVGIMLTFLRTYCSHRRLALTGLVIYECNCWWINPARLWQKKNFKQIWHLVSIFPPLLSLICDTNIWLFFEFWFSFSSANTERSSAAPPESFSPNLATELLYFYLHS